MRMSICLAEMKLTYCLLKRKAVCKPATTRSASLQLRGLQACNYAKGINQHKNNTNDSFGKGFHVLKDHVLNRLVTGRCPCTSLQLWPKFHSLFLQNSFDFQKVLHLKDLNRYLECILM